MTSIQHFDIVSIQFSPIAFSVSSEWEPLKKQMVPSILVFYSTLLFLESLVCMYYLFISNLSCLESK